MTEGCTDGWKDGWTEGLTKKRTRTDGNYPVLQDIVSLGATALLRPTKKHLALKQGKGISVFFSC